MSGITTHVLDTSLGKPAEGIRVKLQYEGAVVGSGLTDRDGRVRELVSGGTPLQEGIYKLTFSVGEYFEATGRDAFYPEIVVSFRIAAGSGHYHVPLLLSPFGYSTYRGS
ncbi:MAG TPA: hydroxyisourate hydrolase [Gemmatimonadaceae bacterium]|nr:hydroxyisourate hydrolase [Gemmatimonadaceae bacterium]